VKLKAKDTYPNSETFRSRITDPKRDFEPKGLKVLMVLITVVLSCKIEVVRKGIEKYAKSLILSGTWIVMIIYISIY
jgi:hypothetical protein